MHATPTAVCDHLANVANKGRDDPRRERENGENPSRIYRVPLCGHRHNESEKGALIIHRRPNAERPFILSNEQRPRDRGVTLLLAAIQPENIELAALCPPDLTQKQAPCRARFTPNPRATLCRSNWDLIAAPLTPFIPRTALSLSAEGGTPPPRGSKRNAQGSC